MIDQLLILAENGSHSTEGIPPYLVGGGFFIVLMCLLGITFLFSGLNQPRRREDAAEHGAEHHGASSTERRTR
ncbi:hypothetical protein [Brachybacterium phenoliresistens]|uniref:Uncharacterized protein n=1 Tax=Brachybacterium phenoliresistens TaxID=396014 RepID=Z9JWK6_9MICO|nr:hypothetical protein [Brachybacterium phenoliresistens]EWS82539.1 hypothetical protein BF93_05730 [Brachybacterium phenoliresistens]